MKKQHLVLPLLALRDIVVFPNMVVPLFVGRKSSMHALDIAVKKNIQIVLATQLDANEDEPHLDELYPVGIVADVLQIIKVPDGTLKILVEGFSRCFINHYSTEGDAQDRLVDVTVFNDGLALSPENEQREIKKLKILFDSYVNSGLRKSQKIAKDVVISLMAETQLLELTNTMAGHIELSIEKKQNLLERCDVGERAELLMEYIEDELSVADIENVLRTRVKKQMEKSQREYYLNEKMKAIRKELGEDEENEYDKLKAQIDKAGMPKAVKEKVYEEIKKLKQMAAASSESAVIRGYVDWLLDVPWKKRSKIKSDIVQADVLLNEHHYGLEEVKERILEYLAVQARTKKLKGPILCLVGPPGVGKTSLGRSIAEATGRKYIRMALGGVRDEAEIRGHRRTYIGAMPGKIIQKMSKVGVKNPLFLLDEIDKISSDFKGDPSSALLEVLDPEQNNTFADNYLEVDYDLSDIMFVCTANSLDIPRPLLDRMEVIRVPGYTEEEKAQIAMQYLLPKQIEANGLVKDEIKLNDKGIRHIIRHYTREAGVRGLERELSKLCRKLVKKNAVAQGVKKAGAKKTGANTSAIKIYKNAMTLKEIETLLGTQKYSFHKNEEVNRVGQVTGLAWTSVGGDLLTIEAVGVPGKGKYIYTGSLGDVMKESIQAALTVVRSRAASLGIEEDFHAKTDLHIHVPEGATPKDGPSAGIAMCTALVSSLTGIEVRSDVAMTGEITLRGEVLAIGGLKEKLLAAHRGNIKTVIIPKENTRDLADIPDKIKADLDIRTVSWIDEVVEIALTQSPSPLKPMRTKGKTKLKKTQKSQESLIN